MALERFSHLGGIKITQAQGKVSYFYLNGGREVNRGTQIRRSVLFFGQTVNRYYVRSNPSPHSLKSSCGIVLLQDPATNGIYCFYANFNQFRFFFISFLGDDSANIPTKVDLNVSVSTIRTSWHKESRIRAKILS